MRLQTLMHCADAMKNFAVVYLVREGESCPPLCRRGAAGAGPGVARWGGALVFEVWVFALNLGVCTFSSAEVWVFALNLGVCTFSSASVSASSVSVSVSDCLSGSV